jgi:pimeloyl-ACP methyl ester carboxylesterase
VRAGQAFVIPAPPTDEEDLVLDLRIALDDSLFGRPVAGAVSVTLPAPQDLPARPAVLFLYPGGGYGRGYYHLQVPGLTGYDESAYHARHGVIVVACDHIGVGDSSQPEARETLTYENVADANHAIAEIVLERLRSGTLETGYPAMPDLLPVGAGQSMGGCLLTVTQARHHTFAGVCFLGWSGRGNVIPTAPGEPALPVYDRRRGGEFVIARSSTERPPDAVVRTFTWAFHHDDEPDVLIEEDVRRGFPARGGKPPMWASTTLPEPVSSTCLQPGVVAAEAAVIDVPVLVGVGERDAVPDLHLDATAYPAASQVSLIRVERMAHMHNFASTRTVLWDRIEAWIEHEVRPAAGRSQGS